MELKLLPSFSNFHNFLGFALKRGALSLIQNNRAKTFHVDATAATNPLVDASQAQDSLTFLHNNRNFLPLVATNK